MSRPDAILLLLVVVPLGVVFIGWYCERLREVLAVLAVAFTALWAGALVSFATGFRDADGAVDCWPNCTAYQDTVKTVAVFALPAVALSGVVALVLAAIGRRRRAARRPG